MQSLPIVQKLVEEQIRRANLFVDRGPVASVGHEHWPVVTFSREPGAGGRTLAHKVSTRLGFTCWDRELVSRIAVESHAIESVLAGVDEHVDSSVTNFVRTLFIGNAYCQDEYGRMLVKVISSIGHKGASVILGRGAHAILDPGKTLRVRVVCPEPQRARRVAQRDGIDGAAALRKVRAAQEEVRAFIKHHFKEDVTDPHHFDLIVNTGNISVDQAVDLVLTAYRTKFGRLPEPAAQGRDAASATPLPRPVQGRSQAVARNLNYYLATRTVRRQSFHP
jgi:cytidylate kinase